jgi:molybdenum cofactor cytidylyltransferase
MPVTCVVLAAGASRRFGSNKLIHEHKGDTLLARAIRACGAHPVVVVCAPELAAGLRDTRAVTIVNAEPERGMAHSLRLADRCIDPAQAIVVLPADLARIEADHVQRTIDALGAADVAYPLRADGVPGHPVVFAPRARVFIRDIPDGDTIRRLRDRDDLVRHTIAVDESWPYADVDTPGDLERR